MNKHIVMLALRTLVLDNNGCINQNDREDALNELLNMQRKGTIDNDTMQSFRQYRTNADRIATIKYIRQVLDCGLSEALIIVKGIDAHDNVPN